MHMIYVILKYTEIIYRQPKDTRVYYTDMICSLMKFLYPDTYHDDCIMIYRYTWCHFTPTHPFPYLNAGFTTVCW